MIARVAPLGSRLVLALVEDRTRERRVEAVRRDFVANVSHELKTPVGAIRLLAEAVTEAADDPEAVERFASPDADRERPAHQAGPADHRALAAPGRRPARGAGPRVASTTWSPRPSTPAPSTRAPRTSPWSPPGSTSSRCSAPSSQISAAVSNLVANAVAYSDAGSRVLVSTKAARRHRADLGRRPGHRHPRPGDRPDLRAVLPRRPGPPPLHRRHRPRPLHRQARRGHPRRRRQRLVRRGAGVDLHPDAPPQPAPQRQRAVRARVDDRAPAPYPRDARPARTPRVKTHHDADTGATNQQEVRRVTRVLVVEDEESYSDALAYMLRKEGYEVAIAADGNSRASPSSSATAPTSCCST